MNKDKAIRVGIIGFIVSWLTLSFPTFAPIPQIMATFVKWTLLLFGIPVAAFDRFLVVDFFGIDRIIDISAECSGIIIFSVFLFVIFITPKFKLAHRLSALLFIPLLFVGNAIRILLSVIIARTYSVDASIFFHNTLGQVLIFGFTILIFMLWLYLVGNFITERQMKAEALK